jgi:uncharacterized protein
VAGDDPHYPGKATIEAYGTGGFRFAGISHRGSILVLPAGIWAWPPRVPAEIDAASLQRILDKRADIDIVVIGTGRDIVLLPEVRKLLREASLAVELLATAAAASTYNVLLAEERRAAAALLAVE